MPNNQSKARRSWRNLGKIIPQAIVDPQLDMVRNGFLPRACLLKLTRNQSQGSSPALIPEIASVSPGSNDISKGKLAKLMNLLPFNRFNKSVASPFINVSPRVQGELFHAPQAAAFILSSVVR